MDIKYQYIKMIAEERNLTKAAEKLYITQPALSKMLKEKESELGVILFDRSSVPLQITEAGTLYLSWQEKMERVEKRMLQQFQELNDMARGDIRVGIPPIRGMYWLPRILPSFYKRYPGIHLEVVEDDNDVLEKLLLEGQLDLYVNATPFLSPNLRYKVIGNEPIYLIASIENEDLPKNITETNSIKSPTLVTPSFISKQRLITLRPATSLSKLTKQVFIDNNMEMPKNTLELQSTETAYLLALQNVGIFFAPKCTVYNNQHNNHRAAFLSLPKKFPVRDITIAYRKGALISRAMEAFMELTEEIARTDSILLME